VAPAEPPSFTEGCDLENYPNACIPFYPPDVDCRDVLPQRNFIVRQPDPHKLDKNKNGIGCEDGE
jgi:micrococcal nuclease